MLSALLYLTAGALSLLAFFNNDSEASIRVLILAQTVFISANVNEIEKLLRGRLYEH